MYFLLETPIFTGKLWVSGSVIALNNQQTTRVASPVKAALGSPGPSKTKVIPDEAGALMRRGYVKLGSGWTNPSEKYDLVKVGHFFPQLRDEHENIWVATT